MRCCCSILMDLRSSRTKRLSMRMLGILFRRGRCYSHRCSYQRTKTNSFIARSLTFWVIGLIFYYGAHQLAAQEINSKQFFVAMIGVIFGSIQAGQVFTYVPDMSKARGAADDVVKLLDSTPEIDAEDASGTKFENCQGSIRFNGELCISFRLRGSDD